MRLKNILLLSRSQGFGTPDGHHIMPLTMYAKELEKRLGVRIINIPTSSPHTRTRAVDDALKSNLAPTHIIIIPRWSEDPDELCTWLKETRTQINQANLSDTKLVLLDTYDQTSSPHFQAFEHVDRYIKGKLLKDRTIYTHDSHSGFVYADFVADTWGFDLKGWHFGSQIPPAHAHKLVCGWSLGITPQYRRLLNSTSTVRVPWSMRRIDLHQRTGGLGTPGKNQQWYQFSRAKGIEAISLLASKFRLSPTGRVSTKRYFAEMCLSKAVFSPFGWGEICFRDYEAIACGCLLIKPDMSHLETEPNIYIPHETYVPIAWDYHNAVEQIEHYLSNPAKAKTLIANARQVLRDYDRTRAFVDTFARCMDIEQ